MTKKLLHLKFWGILTLIGFFCSMNASAQTVDKTGTFDPTLTGTETVYAAIVFNDGNANGNYDAIFTLSDQTITAWTAYAAVVAFYEDGISIRTTAGMVAPASLTNVVIPTPGELVNIWVTLDVPNSKYYVYAQTGSMPAPVSIYDAGGNFRDAATFIDRWSAVHNEPDFLTVQHVATNMPVGQIPASIADPSLKTLSVNVGTLTPAFNPEELNYTLEVPFGTTSVTIAAEANGIGAKVTGTGVIPVVDGYAYAPIIVTAGNGEQAEYVIEVSQAGGATDASLKSLTVNKSALDPIFNRDVLTYNLIVPVGTTSVDVAAVPTFGNAQLTGAGTINLVNGVGTATLTVVSQDASVTTVYTVNIAEADGKNYAMYLPGVNGTTSSIDISGMNLKTLPYTIEIWFKPEGTQAFNAGLFYNRAPGDVQHGGIQYTSSWQVNNSLRFMTNIAGDYGVISPVVANDVWHHMAVTLTETTRTIYVDGVASTQDIPNVALDFSQGKLYIGYDNGATARAFKGSIDEVRVWNTVKTEQELKDSKYAVFNGTETNLVGYWNFDLKNATQAVDLTANNKHGLIAGGTYVESFPRADVGLATLTVSKGTLYPEFNTNVTSYHLILPVGTTSFDIAATTSDVNCTLAGTGTVNVAGTSGTATVTVTSPDGKVNNDYTIAYQLDTELTLKHSYPFGDGSANDVVGNAHGTVNGGTIENGNYTTVNDGEYISLPADVIAINTYPSITLEAYVAAAPAQTDANRILAYLGNTTATFGTDYLFLSHKARAATSCGSYGTPWSAETGVSGTALEDNGPHHMVATMTNGTILFYVDGLLVGESANSASNKIYNLSNALGYLCKSGYNSDKTWLGSINEFNIYSGVMDATTVAVRATQTPTAVNQANNNSIVVYPTVSKGNFTVKGDGNTAVTVMDITGKMVSKQVSDNASQTVNITKPGIYILKIDSQNQTKMAKVIVAQ